MTGMRVGVLTLGARESGEGDHREPARRELALLGALRRLGHEPVSGGLPYTEEDRVARSPSMVRRHVHTLVEHGTAAVVLDVTADPGSQDVAAAVRYLQRELQGPARLVVRADASAVPYTLPRLLQAGRVLHDLGVPADLEAGGVEAAEHLASLDRALAFCARRASAGPAAQDAGRRLCKQRVLLVGPGTRGLAGLAPALTETLGVALEGLRRTRLDRRASEILGGAGAPETATDPRLAAASRCLEGTEPPGGWAAALATYLAATDLARELDAGALVLDELTGLEPVAGWCSDATGPDRRPKDVLPLSPAGDLEVLLTQVVLHLLDGGPAGATSLLDPPPEGGLLLEARSTPPSLRPGPRGRPATLACWEAAAGRCVLHALELELRPDAPEGRLVAALPGGDPKLPPNWPGPRAALARGHRAAELVELACRLGTGVSACDAAGRSYRAKS